MVKLRKWIIRGVWWPVWAALVKILLSPALIYAPSLLRPNFRGVELSADSCFLESSLVEISTVCHHSSAPGPTWVTDSPFFLGISLGKSTSSSLTVWMMSRTIWKVGAPVWTKEIIWSIVKVACNSRFCLDISLRCSLSKASQWIRSAYVIYPIICSLGKFYSHVFFL